MDAKAYYQTGQLTEAIQAATASVKKNPMDAGLRGFLTELLMVNRDWERADKQLDFIGHQAPNAMAGVALWRQLIRAGQARDQFFSEGRVPEVLEEPDELMQTYLKASLSMRDKKLVEAKAILDEAEAMRPKLSGELDGKAFSDFRDLDDLAPGVLEVFTSTGKYYWIPLTRVVSLSLYKPESPVDLILRRAHLHTNNEGPDGEVYIPTVYHALDENDRDNLLLGRATDWIGADNEPVRGIGQRMFLVDDAAKTIMEMEELSFNQQ